MNKIFKVIWNEARNAYVVVSEIAKNHGSKSCSTKKLLAMLIATGVMTCASFDVLAAQPAAEETAAQQYVALKAADFPNGKPNRFNPDTYKHFNSYRDAKDEWDAQEKGEKQIGNYTYALDKNKYWVRKGYVLTVDENGGKYTPLSQKDVRADVAYTGTDVPKGILQSVTSTVAHNGVVTHSGDSLQKITAGSYAGVSNSGGTEVAGSWNYIIKDSSWEDSGAEYQDGYVDLKDDKMPKGFKTIGFGLEWDEAKQTYTYQGKAVDYRNMYVIEGELGVFTNAGGSEVYTGTVYGKNNEILMTVKDNGKFYSYWAASVTDPSATMETYPVSKYNSDMAVIDQNIKDLNKDIIKEVTLTKNTNSAIIRLVRNGGNAVDGAITVTSGGGTGGSGAAHDTFVKISNGTTEQTFATGSKVEAIVDKGATTGIKINGEDYTIKSGSKVSVTQNAAEKTTTITVDDKATIITDTDTHNELKSASLSGKTLTITGKDNDSVNVDLSSIDTDTKYTAGNGIAIGENNGNAISVKLKEGENNLEVTEAGLELKKDLTVNRVAAGDTIVNTNGLAIGIGDKGIVLSTTNVSMGGQQIHNVAKGTNDNDAVNVSQLKETNTKVENLKVEAGKHTTLVNGENTTVEPVGDGTYGKQYKVNVDLSQYAKTEDVAVVYVDNNKNKSLHTTNSGAVESNAIALGKDASAVKDGGVALGNEAYAGNKGTSLGTKAKSGREGATVVGYNTNSSGLYSTVVGTDATINTNGKTVYTKIVQGAAATVVGAMNKIDNTNGEGYSGVANNVMGAANTIEGSNGVTIQGSGNTVTDAYKDMDITYADGWAILRGDYSVLAKKQSGAIAVVGGANTVSKQTDSTVIGYDNRLIGGEENISHDVFLAGSHNELTNVSDSIVMGNENAITGVSNVISFGHKNAITANNAVAIGNGAGVSVEGGVALGVGSVASTAAGALGYGADGKTDATWQATKGAVSVGGNFNLNTTTDDETNVTNYGISLKDSVTIGGTHAVTINGTDGTVTGLTNTTWNKDSITSGRAATEDQLQAVATEAGKHTTLSNGKNTTVESTVKDGQTDYKVNVAGDLTDITSVANGDSKIKLNKDSIIISNGNKYFAITNSGIGMSYIGADYSAKSIMLGKNGTTISGGLNVAGSKITGVAAGVADTDAVNVGQLNAAVQAGNTDTHIKAGEYGVGTDNKVNMQLVDKNGKDAGTVTITDVAKASDVGDVNNIASDIKNKEGKTTVVDAVNNLNNKLDTKVGDLQYSKVEKGDIVDGDSTTTAIGKLDQKLTDVAATAAKHTTVTQGDNITVTPGTNTDGSKNYNVALKKDITVESVTANTFKAGQTVMDKDGLKVGDKVSVSATAVTAGQTSISDEGLAVGPNTSLKADELKVDGKTYIDKNGLNANGMQITNVADGKENSDAVNVGQLKESEKTINNRINGVEN